MTQTTPLPSADATSPVTLEDDATPLVRRVGQALRQSVRAGHAEQFTARTSGTVAIRSHDTPQSATVRVGADGVSVRGGVSVDTDATLVVDVGARFRLTDEPTGDVELAEALLSALTPPFPHWRESAQQFWDLTRSVPGIPDVLVVVHEEEDCSTEVRFGSGDTEFVVAGSSDVLGGLFTGADEFIPALSAGLRVQGTWAQLSVMNSASWKVRFDV